MKHWSEIMKKETQIFSLDTAPYSQDIRTTNKIGVFFGKT